MLSTGSDVLAVVVAESFQPLEDAAEFLPCQLGPFVGAFDQLLLDF